MDCPDESIKEETDVPKVDFITPAQKLVFLKYMQLNTKIITKPQNYPKLLTLMCTEHNKVCEQLEPDEIIKIMQQWVATGKARFNQMISERTSFVFSAEDVELLNLFNSDKQKPNTAELSCILDHLEIAYSSPKVWVTIALEMEALGSKKTEDYWKKAFERWCSKVKRKKQIVDQMDVDESEKTSFLTSLELRVLDVIEKIETEESKKSGYFCRVCLQSKGEELKSIYEVYSDDMTVAQKISQCAQIEEISKDDNLPQFICESCHQLLECAFKFKSLCEFSDTQLRVLAKNKVEYVEYIVEEAEDYQVQTEEDELQESTPIEMNLSFDSKINVTEGELVESEETEQYEESLPSGNVVKIGDDLDVHECEMCSIVCYNEETFKKHMNTHSFARPHPCNVCQKDFKTKLSLRIHMRSHTGERPYVCEVCGKAFTQEGTLSYHRSIHTGAKPYLCNLCDYRARNINDLKIHMRKHTGARPYRCDLCPSKFTTSSNLQKHVRRHTGIKNFQTCGKAFKTWSAVTNHRATHSTVKQFECQHCSYKSTTKANLKIHNRTHTGIQPYQCSQCPLKFSTASNRHKHVKNVHEKLKTHECSTCLRTFFSRESARKHMVIHTGLRPYSCTECSMCYGWYNGLQKHMKTQHPGIKMPTEKYFLDLLEK